MSNPKISWQSFPKSMPCSQFLLQVIDVFECKHSENFISKAFAEGELKTAGTAVIKLLPAKNMFSPGFEHSLQKAFVIDKLKAFFERFSNL